MNRNEEYQNLMAELDNTPPALESSVARAKVKLKKVKRIKHFLVVPLGSATSFFIAFAVMVNLSVPFAMACNRIPLLRELAAAVAFSPSLSAAAENEYVQLIGLEQTLNDITMRVEYVIVDQKQLNIFYTLQSPIYFSMRVDPSIVGSNGSPIEDFVLSLRNSNAENGELRHITADFIDNDVPKSLSLIFKVYNISSHEPSNMQQEPKQMDLFSPPEDSEQDYIADFEFILNFDPSYTQPGEIITLNQSFSMDGQRISANTVEIYPTHMRLNLEADPNNSAWLKSISFYFENEKGERFEPVSNGISATGSADSPMLSSHRLESSFFSDSQSLTLYITNVVWLDKNMERINASLDNCTAENLPEGVVFEEAVRKPEGWELTFSAPENENNSMYQLFGSYYYDTSGNEYMYNITSSTTGYYSDRLGEYIETPGRFYVKFALSGYPYDAVQLSPSFSRTTILNEAIVITIK